MYKNRSWWNIKWPKNDGIQHLLRKDEMLIQVRGNNKFECYILPILKQDKAKKWRAKKTEGHPTKKGVDMKCPEQLKEVTSIPVKFFDTYKQELRKKEKGVHVKCHYRSRKIGSLSVKSIQVWKQDKAKKWQAKKGHPTSTQKEVDMNWPKQRKEKAIMHVKLSDK